jgi:hypothetical protein
LDAIEAVASMGFRPEARKVMLVVTDAPAHRRGDGTDYSNRTQEEVKDDLVASGVLLVVVSPVLKKRASYVDLRDLADNSQGLWLDMGSANFSGILDKFTSIITETYVIEYGKVDWDEYTPEVTVTVKSPGCANGSIARSYRSKTHPELLPYEGININELNQSERGAYYRIFDKIHPPPHILLPPSPQGGSLELISRASPPPDAGIPRPSAQGRALSAVRDEEGGALR